MITVLILVLWQVIAASPPRMLGTGDTEGHVLPCTACPLHPGLGGLSRRVPIIAQSRKQNSALLLADAGNFLVGPQSLESRGKVVIAAYNALGYDAVNLSYRDFRLGKTETLAMLKEAKFSLLSANLLDEQTGKPLATPYVVKKVGDQRLALIGVTEVPAGLDFLPHLKEQLAGIKIEPPVEAVAKWLPKAKAEADRVVLLYYGSPGNLRPIRERFGGELAVILVGGTRPEYLPVDAQPPLVGTSEHGKHLAHVKLSFDGKATKVEVKQIAVEPSIPPDPEMEKLLAKYKTGEAHSVPRPK